MGSLNSARILLLKRVYRAAEYETNAMNRLRIRRPFMIVAVATGLWALPGHAEVTFGDDSSRWAHDGECDDPRFIGDGMAETLVAADFYTDAADCRKLFEAGRIRLRGGDTTVPGGPIDFGADTGDWVFDGECDDPRFVGNGMADVLLEEDRLADATDCRTLFEAGLIELRADGGKKRGGGAGVPAVALQPGIAAYGQLAPSDALLDAGEYCDHFTFKGMTGALAVVMLRSDDFDPYLIVRAPSGEQIDNDDYEGDASRSVVALPMDEAGTYTIGVTSYQPGETGTYSLLVELQADTPALPASVVPGELGVRAENERTDGRVRLADAGPLRPASAMVP